MWRGLQGRGEAGGAVVGSQWQGEGRGCCCHRRSRWMLGKVQGGRGPVELGAWGAAAAVKTESMRATENGARRD